LARKQHVKGGARRVFTFSETRGDEVGERWVVFDSTVDVKGYRPGARVEVAFQVVENLHERRRVVGVADDTQLVAFFPTVRETHLGFLIQGPYVPTATRDNVREDHPFNRALVAATADLVVESLEKLKALDLLDAHALEALPLDPRHFPDGSLFAPIFTAVRKGLRLRHLVPTAPGGHAPALQCRLAGSSELRGLLSGKQLTELFSSKERLSWATPAISETRTPALFRYLAGHRQYSWTESSEDIHALVPGFLVEPATVLSRLTPNFLAKQDDAWMIKLYCFLGGLPALNAIARKRPLVRLEDGSHVAAFDDCDAPQAWLPSPGDGEYPSVRGRISADDGARKWLKAIGLSEPDIVDLVVEKVLPNYVGARAAELDSQTYRQDLARIDVALKQASGEKGARLRDALAATPFLVGRSAASNERFFRCPDSLFAPTPQLQLLFEGNPKVFFLDEELSGKAETWQVVGVRVEPLVQYRSLPWSGDFIVLRRSKGDHARGLDGFDPGFDIPGLDFALQHPSVEKALEIWKLITPYRGTVRGVVQTSNHQTYDWVCEETCFSKLGQLLASTPWLPDRQGAFHLASELLLEELHESFPRDDRLAAALLMKPKLSVPPAVKAALGIGDEEIAFLMKNKEMVLEVIQELRKRERFSSGVAMGPEKPVPKDADEPISLDANGSERPPDLPYRALVAKAFSRPVSSSPASSSLGPGLAPDPERRQLKTEQEIAEEQRVEPNPEKRFVKVPRKVWEDRNGLVRAFLFEEYQGRCQVCGETFCMRSGKPYFEGLYLVPHVIARWMDRPGDVLCLCATCSAKFQHGAVELDAFDERVLDLDPLRAGSGNLIALSFHLCGEERELHYSQKHLIDLQALIRS